VRAQRRASVHAASWFEYCLYMHMPRGAVSPVVKHSSAKVRQRTRTRTRSISYILHVHGERYKA